MSEYTATAAAQSSSSASASAAAAAATEERMVQLTSQDNETFDVTVTIAQMSKLVTTMLDENDEELQVIPLPNVRAFILAKVIEFCKHYQIDKMMTIEKVIQLIPLFT